MIKIDDLENVVKKLGEQNGFCIHPELEEIGFMDDCFGGQMQLGNCYTCHTTIRIHPDKYYPLRWHRRSSGEVYWIYAKREK